MTSVFIGLGSNLDNPQSQLKMALTQVARLPQTRLIRHSRLYRSKPMGPQDQPDYINAVAELDTQLEARNLMHGLQAIERDMGRKRDPGQPWGARVIDLDILVFGDETVNDPDLVIPHPGIAEREFVVFPLLEIADQLSIPGLGSLAQLATQVSMNSMHVVEDP